MKADKHMVQVVGGQITMRRPTHKANQYPKGRGKMLCGVCGKPVRDHDTLGRCEGVKTDER